jgi:hypothetical protein
MELAHGIFRAQTVHASPQRDGNSSMLHAMHSTIKPTETHTETPLPLSMVAVRPTSNSSFSEMHTRKLSTTEPWTSYQTSSTYEHHNGAPSRPAALSVTNAHRYPNFRCRCRTDGTLRSNNREIRKTALWRVQS